MLVMPETETLEEKMCAIMRELKEAIDLSVVIIQQEPAAKKAIFYFWERFISTFLAYATYKSREVGQNLLTAISLAGLRRWL